MHFILKYTCCLFLALLGTTQLAAQDLIARQAPIDRRTKAIDSLTLSRAEKRVAATTYANNDLYGDTWNTSKVHCYAHLELPETHRIDLRGFCMPTPSRNVTSHFGYRSTFRRVHKGMDIKVYTGDTIVAAFDGKVRIVSYEGSGYGNYVVIRHNNGLETIYGHLSKSIAVPGETVKAGQVIGLGGNTGRSFGSHLHFETRFLGVAIDPVLLFDFPNQDVTGNYFVFRRDECQGGLLTRRANATPPSATLASNEPRHTTAEPKRKAVSKPEATLQGKHYKVMTGDTPYGIARKIGITLESLYELNGLTEKSTLITGQLLRY